MTTPSSPHDRLLELLADREVGSLHEADRAELEAILASSPEADDGSMEQAAVAAMLANLGEPEEMPDTLRQRTLHALAAEERQSGRSVAAEPKPLTLEGSSQVIPSTHTPFLAWIGWVAAAACVLIAGFTIISRPAPTPTPTPPVPVQTLAESRRAFLESTPDLRTAQWGDWDNPELPGVTGTVEWSESAQKGYMTFEGLAVNVPTVEQYQLWIIDERGMEQRISGAIFDSTSEGDLIVEIDPGIAVHNAAAFAVTIEQPEGVWVSDMSRRVVIASLEG